MLRRTSTLTPSFGGLRERECPRCHRAVDLPLGALCDACRRELDVHAGRVARWVSLLTTLAFGVYATVVLPPHQTARLVGAAGTVVWYLVARRVAFQVARTWLETRRETGNDHQSPTSDVKREP